MRVRQRRERSSPSVSVRDRAAVAPAQALGATGSSDRHGAGRAPRLAPGKRTEILVSIKPPDDAKVCTRNAQ